MTSARLRTDLEMAQLELEQLNATLEDQQAELERIQKLMDSTYDDATKRQYALDLREQNVKVLETKANIATKKKDIEKLKANTADSTVKSPVDGEVQSLNAGRRHGQLRQRPAVHDHRGDGRLPHQGLCE